MQQEPQWKKQVQDILKTCGKELKKTAEIGKKMLSASKANTCLHDTYEELGQLVADAIKNNELSWDHPRVEELLSTISDCKKNLKNIAGDVKNIKAKQQSEEARE